MLLTQAPGQRVPKLWYCRLESDHVCIAKQDHHDYFEIAGHWLNRNSSTIQRFQRREYCKSPNLQGAGGRSPSCQFSISDDQVAVGYHIRRKYKQAPKSHISLTWNRSRCSLTLFAVHTSLIVVTYNWPTSPELYAVCEHTHASRCGVQLLLLKIAIPRSGRVLS